MHSDTRSLLAQLIGLVCGAVTAALCLGYGQAPLPGWLQGVLTLPAMFGGQVLGGFTALQWEYQGE